MITLNRDLIVFAAVGSVIVLFLVIPVITCLAEGGAYIGEAASDVDALDSIYVGFHAGTVCSLVSLLFGTPLAYFLSRWRGSLSSFIQSIIEIPLAIPHSVAGIMLLLAYSSRSPIGSLLSNVGLIIEDSYWGIVFAMLFVSSPIYITTVKAGFDSIDVEIENVARTLGASRIKVFLEVTLPLSLKHILAGFILTLARAVSEVGAVMVIAYYPKIASVLVIERFLGYGLRSALALSALLALISLTIFVILRLIIRWK